MCKRCGKTSDGEYCADCTRIRETLKSALPRHLSGLMGPASRNQCHYCPSRARSWDHIVPRNLHGPDDARNLVPACHPCNQAKADSRGPCRCEKCRTAWRLFGPPGTGDSRVIPGYSAPTSEH